VPNLGVPNRSPPPPLALARLAAGGENKSSMTPPLSRLARAGGGDIRPVSTTRRALGTTIAGSTFSRASPSPSTSSASSIGVVRPPPPPPSPSPAFASPRLARRALADGDGDAFDRGLRRGVVVIERETDEGVRVAVSRADDDF
jgi:hypothetical protein